MEVDGVDLWERWGLALTDDYELGAPKPKVYTVDVPYGDGSIDDSELSGDVAFRDRSQSFLLLAAHPADFERTKTEVSNFLNGRRCDYRLSMDPLYTYRGRFSVDSYYSRMHHGVIRVSVLADPYKTLEERTVRFASNGGEHATLPSGRQRQVPTVECAVECHVVVNGAQATFQPGTWRHPDLVLREGDNDVYVAAALPQGGGDLALSHLGAVPLSDLAGVRLGDLAWRERPPDTEQFAVYLSYAHRDL